jgi:ABC-type phosphate transport system substrate-binding protein
MRARGNEGVAALVKISEGAIGYVEFGFAEKLRLPMARLQNKAGRYMTPSDGSGQAALASALDQMPGNLRLYVPDPGGEESYPDRVVELALAVRALRGSAEERSAQAVRDMGTVSRPVIQRGARLRGTPGRNRLALPRSGGTHSVGSPVWLACPAPPGAIVRVLEI